MYVKDTTMPETRQYTQKKQSNRVYYPEPDVIANKAPKDFGSNITPPTQTFHVVKDITPTTTKKFVTHVTISDYHPVAKECDSTPDVMANNQKIDFKKLKSGALRVVAISRDLLCYLPFGSVVDIEGYGRYVVCDLMNARYNHCIDIMLHPSDKTSFKEKHIKVTKIS